MEEMDCVPFMWLLFSRSVVSDSLWPHGLQHTRLLCPSPTPRACSNSCPWSRCCHPTFLSSIIPFSSCLQSFPAPGSFPMSWIFTSGGQSIGASTSVISPSNEYSGLIFFRMDWLDFLAFQRTLKNLLPHHSSKTSILWFSAFFRSYFHTHVEKAMASHSSTLAWKNPMDGGAW